MSVETRQVPAREGPGSSAPRRVAALARAEFALLRRNKLLMFNAVLLPLLPFGLLIPLHINDSLNDDMATMVLTLMVALLLLFVVYYNLLSSYVARREELVLKRLRTGECSDAEILAGTAVPAVTIVLGMVLLMVLVGSLVLGLPVPTNPVLLGWGVVGGALVFTSLALITTVFTRNSEAAQITSSPIIVISMLGMPFAIPRDSLPGVVGDLVPFLPLAPVSELTVLGWMGVTEAGERVEFAEGFGYAWQPSLVMAGWIILGAAVVRAYFRWEPRR